MGKVDGLIIPRSYNDYFSRSDPQAIQELVKDFSDNALSTISENPVQNKVITAAINLINALIPAQATAQNQLADKAFVNSSIGTNTANYISNNGQPFTSVAALEAYSGTVTNNDYAIVTGTDSAGNVYYDRYKATVSGASVSWAFEYRLNNSSFTAEQWAAITSGITAAKVAQYDNANIPVGFIMPQYKKVDRAGWLYLDGRDTTGTEDELETVYPGLYEYLGNSNVLPDYRECAIVGAEQNTSDTIATHDVYTIGEFKDDAFQNFGKNKGVVRFRSCGTTKDHVALWSSITGIFKSTKVTSSAASMDTKTGLGYAYELEIDPSLNSSNRTEDVTRGKRKAAYFYIKAM